MYRQQTFRYPRSEQRTNEASAAFAFAGVDRPIPVSAIQAAHPKNTTGASISRALESTKRLVDDGNNLIRPDQLRQYDLGLRRNVLDRHSVKQNTGRWLPPSHA